jgi:hypothetical protein
MTSLEKEKNKRTLKDLVNTPFKKAMFGVQLLSYVLIPGSPFIGGIIGKAIRLTTAQTGGLILGIFILGEVLFYGSLFFLGKEVLLIVKDSFKQWFSKFKKK